MTRFRSLLIFGFMSLAAGSFLAAQEKPDREVRSQSYPGSNPHLNNKESIRGGLSLYRRLCGECHALDATGYRGPSLIAYMANGAADERPAQRRNPLVARFLHLAAEARQVDRLDLAAACNALPPFIEALNNWYIRRSRERFWNEHNFVFRKSDGLFYHAKGATPTVTVETLLKRAGALPSR